MPSLTDRKSHQVKSAMLQESVPAWPQSQALQAAAAQKQGNVRRAQDADRYWHEGAGRERLGRVSLGTHRWAHIRERQGRQPKVR